METHSAGAGVRTMSTANAPMSMLNSTTTKRPNVEHPVFTGLRAHGGGVIGVSGESYSPRKRAVGIPTY